MSGFDVVAAGYFLRSIPYPDVRSVTIETGTRNRTQFMDGSKPEGIAFRAHTLKSDRPSKRASGKSLQQIPLRLTRFRKMSSKPTSGQRFLGWVHTSVRSCRFRQKWTTGRLTAATFAAPSRLRAVIYFGLRRPLPEPPFRR